VKPVFVASWALLGALATYSVARTLLAPDTSASASPAIVADFAVPADVRGLQGTSSLDTIVPQPDGAIVLSGWIFDEGAHRAGEGMYVDIDGTMRIAARYHEPRPDVKAAFPALDSSAVGFHATIRPGQLRTGDHRLRLGIQSDGVRYESVQRFALRVGP